MRTWLEMIDDLERITKELRDKWAEEMKGRGLVPSRPKGKWIDNPPDSWICSNCGTHYEERLTFKAHNYCCVCGADMRGEK